LREAGAADDAGVIIVLTKLTGPAFTSTMKARGLFKALSLKVGKTLKTPAPLEVKETSYWPPPLSTILEN
jgi:hypothetical protein